MDGPPLALLAVAGALAGCASAAPAPAVHFLPGADAAGAGAPGSFLSAFALADDGASFTAGVFAVAGGTLRFDEVALLANDDDAPHVVTFDARAASPPAAVVLRFDLLGPDDVRASVDLSSPAVHEFLLGPRQRVAVALTVIAPEGAALGAAPGEVTGRAA